ncbi:MAG: hypothetical protein ACR2OW_14425 [Methyloligellaceae bacterium]
MTRSKLFPLNMLTVAIATITTLGFVGLAEAALREPKFIDGWILATLFIPQMMLHILNHSDRIRIKITQPGTVNRRQTFHIYCGTFTSVMFLFHAELDLPGSMLGATLWGLFILVVASGFLGMSLERFFLRTVKQLNITTKQPNSDPNALQQTNRIETLLSTLLTRVELNPEIENSTRKIYDFFQQKPNVWKLLKEPRLPLQRFLIHLEEIEDIIGSDGSAAIAELKREAVDKLAADFQLSYDKIRSSWLLVHVPATYSLLIVSLVHIAIISAFSTGVP